MRLNRHGGSDGVLGRNREHGNAGDSGGNGANNPTVDESVLLHEAGSGVGKDDLGCEPVEDLDGLHVLGLVDVLELAGGGVVRAIAVGVGVEGSALDGLLALEGL